MTMVEGPTSFVLFHEGAPLAGGRAHSEAGEHPIEYLRARERDERAAAKRATSRAARSAHQELAQHYAHKITTQGGRHGA